MSMPSERFFLFPPVLDIGQASFGQVIDAVFSGLGVVNEPEQ
jgi:hypothetical protein